MDAEKKRNNNYTRRLEEPSKKIYRKRKEDLLDFLYETYLKKLFIGEEEPTLESIYPRWLEYKTTITDSPSTITTIDKHYHKYFYGSDLFARPISAITTRELNLYINDLIRKEQLSSKQWQTIKIIPKQIFEYAIDEGIIDNNPFEAVRVTVKYRQTRKKTSEKETYNSAEIEKILDELWTSYVEKGEPKYIAVMWNFYCGLRAGELSGLKWEDIDTKKNTVTIRREVVCMAAATLNLPAYHELIANGIYKILPDQDGKKWVYVLLEHTKTHRERIIDLPSLAMDLLSVLPQDSDFVFAAKNGKVLTLRQINAVLEDACVHVAQADGAEGSVAELRKKVNIKRSHKIRKTYASTLNAAGMPVDRIRDYLGHSSLQTTLGYLYDPLTDYERKQRLEEAFAGGHPDITPRHPKKDGDS